MFSRVLFLSGVPAFGLRGSPGPRIFKRTVIPAEARAVVGGTDFRSLLRPFRGSPFFAGKRARRARIQALASFRERGKAPMFGPRTFGKQAFVFRRIGILVPSRCRSLRFGHFRRRLTPRRRGLNGGLDSGSPRALSNATPPDFNGLSRMRGILARLGKRALRAE